MSRNHMYKHRWYRVVGPLFFALLGIQTAFAQNGAKYGLDQAAQGTGLEGRSLEGSINQIITTIVSIVGTIFLMLIVWAGFRWMTAGGNDQQIAQSKKIITGAAIGLALILAGYIITYWLTIALNTGLS